jgi:DNA modification methylase
MARPACIVMRGDAAGLLRRRVTTESVDLVYLDPPFGTQQVWSGKAGSFSDRFTWDKAARERELLLRIARPRWSGLFACLPIDDRDRAYLVFVGELLLELRRTMKPHASLWLHCDDTMGAYIKLVLDAVFGPTNFLGTVIWRRATAHSSRRRFGRIHDQIHIYGRSPRARRRMVAIDAPLVREGFSEIALNATSRERVGYPTQKPVALLEHVIDAATRPGDLVLDPTCGSGTTLVAALRRGRRAIGLDRSAAACRVATTRLRFAGKTR